MQTYYIGKEEIHGDCLVPTGELAHHLSRVLRLRPGDELRFSDGEAYYYDGRIETIAKDNVVVTIEKTYPIEDEAKLQVTLVQCLPRGDKMEQILQKATELGVSRVIPVESKNSQIRLKGKGMEKQRRWQKIAAAAAEQCGRGKIPVVSLPCALMDAVSAAAAEGPVIFCYEREENHSLSKTLAAIGKQSERLTVVIGPEGGFSPAEAEAIIAMGGYSVTMGRRILRVETAGPTALAVIMFAYGEWEVNA